MITLTRLTTSDRYRALVHHWDLVRELVSRDLKVRYKRSVLGIVWSLVYPLAQMAVFTFLFRRVVPLGIENYPTFVFIGVLAWNWFQTALVQATGAITDNRELIRQPGFPIQILPVISVTSQLIHFGLGLPVLFLFMALGGVRLGWSLVALPLVMLVQFLFTLSVGYLTAAAQVLFRDVQHLVLVLLLLLFYLSPIFYDAGAVPERYRWLYHLNPMYQIISAYRAVALQARLPSLASLGGLLGAVLLLLGLGHAAFMQASTRFVEEL